MMQPMQGARRHTECERQGMTQAQYEHKLVIDRCIIALHDFGSRPGATRAKVMRQLKAEGFTANEIAQAVDEMAGNSGELSIDH